MKSKYPARKIARFNFWLTIYFVLFGFVSTMASTGMAHWQFAVKSAIIGSIFLLTNTFINLGLLLYFEHRIKPNTWSGKITYLLTSFLLSILVIELVVFVSGIILQSPAHMQTYLFTIILSILINLLVVALQNYVTIQDTKHKWDLENSQLRAANIDAANQLLRRQIHPHFLFNALNILKSLYKVNPLAGEEYLIKLSDFLRAAVTTNNIKVIPVKEEIKLCEDYLAMQKIRFGSALTYAINLPENALATGYLPSFSIQPLLENAIKHNELTDEFPLVIQIKQKGDYIQVINNIKLKATNEASTGSGLVNLAERYRILSGDELKIEETENTFCVTIRVLSHEFSSASNKVQPSGRLA